MKEYEQYEDTKINFQAVILIGLIILVGIFYIYPIIFKPVKEVAPINESKAIQIEYIYVNVTPTPDGKSYYAGEFEEGIRKIQNPFTITRKNASGLKEFKIYTFVYDYKTYNKLHWFNSADYKWYEQYPENGKKFLFVFYAIYMDDVEGDDTRFYLPNSGKFIVYNFDEPNRFYYPVEYPKHIRYKELEYARDFTNTIQAQYFGTTRINTQSKEYVKSAGEYADEHTWLKGGISNAESGYILYEIPQNTPEENLVAGFNLYSWGSAFWRLKP